MTSDFHNHSLPGMDTGAQNIGQSAFMLERLACLGIKRVFFTPSYSKSREYSIKNFIRRRKLAFSAIKNIIPHGLKTLIGAELMVEEGVASQEGFSMLAMAKTRYVLLSLPLKNGYPEWLNDELNRILHKRKLIPIFAGFERYYYTYPVAAYKKLMTIPGAVYQFNLNSLAVRNTIGTILHLYGKDKPIIFGTNTKNDLNRIPETDPLFYLKNAVPLADYNYLIIKSNNFLKKQN